MLVAGVLVALLGAGLALWTSVAIERHELAALSEPQPLQRGAILTAPLEAGDWVTFEVCAERVLDDLLPAEGEAPAAALLVARVDEPVEILRVPMNAELRASLNSDGSRSCAVLGESRGDGLPESGVYGIVVDEAPEGELASVRFVGRILARRPLGAAPLLPAGAVVLGVLLALVGALLLPPPSAPPVVSWVMPAAAVTALILVVVLPGMIPLGGATIALLRGLLIATAQVSLAWFLAPGRQRLLIFGDSRSWRARLLVLASPLLGLAVVVIGSLVHRLVPTTGEAPIQALVAWPSGAFAAAMVGLMAPVAEELFFRGLLWSYVSPRLGTLAAFLLTTLVFVAVHLPHQWGDWGATMSVLVAGAAFGALRWVSGSVVPGAATHFVHNAALSAPAVL